MKFLVTAIAVGALAASAALAAPGGAPQSMKATSGGKTVKSTQGSYCGAGGGVGICADYRYPLHVKCKLPVKPGGVVTITTARVALTVSASLVGRNPVGHLKRLKKAPGGTDAGWRFRLPANVREYPAVSASASYGDGDSKTWTGFATQACRDADFS